MTRIKLKSYDDVKMSFVGVIDSREFAELLKANFMKSMAFEIKSLVDRKPNIHLYKIYKVDVSPQYF